MTTVYSKKELSYNSDTLKSLYLQGIEHIKLHRGKWYTIQYSQAQRAYYATVAMIQRDI